MLISRNLATNSAKSHPRLRQQSAEGKISKVLSGNSICHWPCERIILSTDETHTVAENSISFFTQYCHNSKFITG
jgi:hypothetical protein